MPEKNSESPKTGMWAFVDEHRKKLAEAFVSVLTEKGLDWRQGWDADSASPQNAVTGKPYQGVNRFNLALLGMARGYTDPRWVTMAQIMDRKGTYHPGEKWHLQAGSKAVHVEYWYPYDNELKKAVEWKDWRQLSSEDRTSSRYSMRVKYTPVFHASMVDGMEPWSPSVRPAQPLSEVVQKLSASMGVELLFDGGGQAFYSPGEDKIHLPAPGSFHGEYEFNATSLHELTHATGHPSRLNRDMSGHLGSESYAYEELVAEIGAAFMGVTLDTQQMPQHLENHKAYVQAWIDAIRDKPDMLAKAINDAQQAANYMEQQLDSAVKAKEQEREQMNAENERDKFGGNPGYYKYFYSPDQNQEAIAFQRETGWNRIFGSEEQGLNGDTVVIYRSVDDLPKFLRSYAQAESDRQQGHTEPQIDGDAIRQAAAQLPFTPAEELELGE